MEVTNSELLQTIADLKSEIDDQTHLCSNVSKLEKIKSEDIQELVSSTLLKITKFKKLQNVLLNRNYLEKIKYNDIDMNIQSLIKIKEGLLLKKKVQTILISAHTDTDGLVKVSIDAFQQVQEYKKQLSAIHRILDNFNKTKFTLEDYE